MTCSRRVAVRSEFEGSGRASGACGRGLHRPRTSPPLERPAERCGPRAGAASRLGDRLFAWEGLSGADYDLERLARALGAASSALVVLDYCWRALASLRVTVAERAREASATRILPTGAAACGHAVVLRTCGAGKRSAGAPVRAP